MNICHKESVKPVSTRLSPVSRPIIRTIIFGPYLSSAQPAIKALTPERTMLTDITADVAARVSSNSFSIDLKKIPKVKRIP